MLRAVIAWSPMLALIPALLYSVKKGGLAMGYPGTRAIALFLAAVGALYAVYRPERGIQDQLAGTYLVPR